MMNRLKFLCVVLLLLFGLNARASAQSATAQITGIVTDSSGAVVRDAKVTVTSELTGFTRSTTTDANGIYTFPLLTVSVYSVTADMKGFKLAKESSIQLNVDQVARVNFTLVPGSVSETIEVTANTATIDTENSAVSSTVTQKQVVDLPIESRSWLGLLQLEAGTVYTSGEQGGAQKNQGDAISINGGRPTSNNYTLDGTSITDTNYNTPAGLMSIDAIQEFKVQTSTYSAEYGFSANQVNIVSKSGTNDLHGTAFEFFQDNAFNAKNAYSHSSPAYKQHQFGFVVGGPVYLPKLYNGRNKTFFLVNYEGLRIRSAGATGYTFVPDPSWLTGQFDTSTFDYQQNKTVPVTILDPTTKQPFPNNQIPTSRFSRLANVVIANNYFPAPNITDPAQIAAHGGNFSYNVPTPNNQDQQTYRVDQNLGSWGTIYGRATYLHFKGTSQPSEGAITPRGDIFWDQPSYNWQVSHTKTFGQNIVNVFRIGWLDTTINSVGPAPPLDQINAIGFTGIYQNVAAQYRSWPFIGFNGPGNLGNAGGAQYANGLSDELLWDISDTVNIQHGRHQMVTGIDVRHWTQNRGAGGSQIYGNFFYNGDFTSAATNTAENGFADFLLGYFDLTEAVQPTSFSDPKVPGSPHHFRHNYIAPFFQDNWRINSKLTVNLGARFDYYAVPYEQNNHMMWLDPSNAAGGLCVADKKLVPEFTGDNTYYRYCGSNRPKNADSWYHPFAPRIGFAYRPFTNTVVRGGYGMFFDSSEEKELEGSALFPYGAGTNINQSPASPQIVTTDQLFSPVSLTGPAYPVDNSFVAVIISEHPHHPYMQQWTLGIQQQLDSKTTFEINYTGNKSTHLLMRLNINQSVAPSAAEVTCFQNLPPDENGYKDPNLCFSSIYPRRPYPGQDANGDWLSTGLGGYLDSSFTGWANYNAMNIKLQRQTHDLVLAAFYTWAKSLDSKSAAAAIGYSGYGWQGPSDAHNVRYDYGRSDFDLGNRFMASAVYQLPIGRGKKLLSNVGRATNLLVGGWQVNGILTIQQGPPYSIPNSDGVGLYELDTYNNRANKVGNPGSGTCPNGFKVGTMQCYFNISAFANPETGAWGNTSRNAYTSPGLVNLDSSIFKDLIFSEKFRAQMRLETFNTVNHVNWGAPDFNLGSSTFGKITWVKSPRTVQLGLKLIF